MEFATMLVHRLIFFVVGVSHIPPITILILHVHVQSLHRGNSTDFITTTRLSNWMNENIPQIIDSRFYEEGVDTKRYRTAKIFIPFLKWTVFNIGEPQKSVKAKIIYFKRVQYTLCTWDYFQSRLLLKARLLNNPFPGSFPRISSTFSKVILPLYNMLQLFHIHKK